MIEETALAEPAPTTEPADKISQTMEAAYDRAQSTPAGPRRLPDERSFPRAATEAGKTERSFSPTETAVSNEIRPPVSLDAKTREFWKSLPPEVQQYISQRELQSQQKISELGREAGTARELSGVFEQYQQSIPRMADGQPMQPRAVVERLLRAHQLLEQSPREAIEWLARSKGIDLAEFGQHAPPQIDLEQVRHEARQEALQHLHQQQQAVHEQQASNYISKFAEGKSYWPQIENQVLYHIMALKSVSPEMDFREVLQLAHDRALAEHPHLDPRVKEKEASARQEAAKKAAEAKRLASINVGSRSLGRAVSARRGSLEDTMRDVADRLMPD